MHYEIKPQFDLTHTVTIPAPTVTLDPVRLVRMTVTVSGALTYALRMRPLIVTLKAAWADIPRLAPATVTVVVACAPEAIAPGVQVALLLSPRGNIRDMVLVRFAMAVTQFCKTFMIWVKLELPPVNGFIDIRFSFIGRYYGLCPVGNAFKSGSPSLQNAPTSEPSGADEVQSICIAASRVRERMMMYSVFSTLKGPI